MNVYTLYVEDDRYSVPTIDILTAVSDEDARQLAVLRLASSPHYLSIAVWDDERFICEVPSPEAASPPPAAPGAP